MQWLTCKLHGHTIQVYITWQVFGYKAFHNKINNYIVDRYILEHCALCLKLVRVYIPLIALFKFGGYGKEIHICAM